jgi:hypothetical protein
MATMDQFIDECMADAGFPEFIVVNVWDPDYVPTEPWDAGLSADRAAAAVLAQWGNPAGGADYRWEDAGCQGYGTHQIGADNAN